MIRRRPDLATGSLPAFGPRRAHPVGSALRIFAAMPAESPPSAHRPDPGTPDPDLSVVIVNYNVREFLEQTLRSVARASRRLRVETFVVDNNSVDGSVPMVRSHFPEVHLIANERNVGFGAANNQALRRARGRYVLILNPDTIVQEDTLETLVRFMDGRPGAGAAGCRILNPDGTFAPESRRAFPTPRIAFFRMTGLSRLFPQSRVFGRYNMTFLPVDQEAEVDALSGSCMLVRREALFGGDGRPGAGLFDEDFFMYGEDLDLCFRIQKAGWSIHYTPETRIIHYKGESTKKGEFRYVRLFYGAMVLFARKHLHGRYSRLLIALLQAAIVVRAGASLLSGAARRLAAPIADFVLVFGVVALGGWIRSIPEDASLGTLFFLTVAPAYATGTVLGIAASGGYRRGSLGRMRPVVTGTLAGFVLVATISFFVPAIAFSRAVVAASLPVGALLLALWRLVRHARSSGARLALLVGSEDEAVRLDRMLGSHPHPPFRLLGYVDPASDADAPGDGDPSWGPHHLGALHHLRDLVRLHAVDNVVFATGSLSNRRIFEIIQSIRDLPVEFRMLAEGRSHVIGKASVSDLTVPDLEARVSDAVRIRSLAARRFFELPASLLGLVLVPPVALAAAVTGTGSRARRALRRLVRLPGVLTGRFALVGMSPAHAELVPQDWRLKEGVFNISDVLAGRNPAAEEISRAYGYYVTSQSAALDWDIIIRTLTAR